MNDLMTKEMYELNQWVEQTRTRLLRAWWGRQLLLSEFEAAVMARQTLAVKMNAGGNAVSAPVATRDTLAQASRLKQELWAEEAMAAWKNWCELHALPWEDELAIARFLAVWAAAVEALAEGAGSYEMRLPYIAVKDGRPLNYEGVMSGVVDAK